MSTKRSKSNEKATQATWSIDLDRIKTEANMPSFQYKSRRKGRCQNCWGRLVGQLTDQANGKSLWTSLRCMVCNQTLANSAANKEENRIALESSQNMLEMVNKGYPSYVKGAFAIKVFPNIKRLPKSKLENRIIKAKRQAGRSLKNTLNRKRLPGGTPGFFVLQAKLIVKGMERAIPPHLKSILDTPEIKNKNSKLQHANYSEAIGTLNDPQYKEYVVHSNVGMNMSAMMSLAFACELTMKAISLTCKDKAVKEHDLIKLFHDLPSANRQRLVADFPKIEDVFLKARHIAGNWKYLERSTSDETIEAMMNVELARDIGKSARVLLDEAEMMGIAGEIEKINVRGVAQKEGDIGIPKQKITTKIRGGESPPSSKNKLHVENTYEVDTR